MQARWTVGIVLMVAACGDPQSTNPADEPRCAALVDMLTLPMSSGGITLADTSGDGIPELWRLRLVDGEHTAGTGYVRQPDESYREGLTFDGLLGAEGELMDLDGDGRSDLFLREPDDQSEFDETWRWYLSAPDGTPSEPPRSTSVRSERLLGFIDLDGDAWADVVRYDYSPPGRSFVEAGIDGRQVDFPTSGLVEDSAGVTRVEHDPSLFLLHQTSESLGASYLNVTLYRVVGESFEVLWQAEPSVNSGSARAVAFPEDGRVQVFIRQSVSVEGEPTRRIRRYDIDLGTHMTTEDIVAPAVDEIFEVADLDGDGHEDLVWRSPEGDLRVRFGGPGHELGVEQSFPYEGFMLDVEDLDGSGAAAVVLSTDDEANDTRSYAALHLGRCG
jgi:hypothetical protein